MVRCRLSLRAGARKSARGRARVCFMVLRVYVRGRARASSRSGARVRARAGFGARARAREIVSVRRVGFARAC